MDAINHHLPAIYAAIAVIAIPGVLVVLFRYFARRQQRLSREAMLRGNRLHRSWLEQSKETREP